ncbi:carbohydrate ABC transporter permease [Tabrizicola sp. BL-A-41-H6]|uniref:carbohydrate ABC transporter permease n=1 Tax=Tabrizicola sp. BL-A-41-H6 TaxID=3421107 RepID=UPI003D67A4B2
MAVDLSTLDFDAIIRAEARKKRRGVWKVALGVILALVWVLPFWFLFLTIFKSTEEYASGNPLDLPLGIAPLWDNISRAWDLGGMGQAMLNSALYGVVGAGSAVFIAAMAAFALARLDLPRREAWFLLIFAGTVFPFQMFLIPLFFGYQSLGLLNSRLGMCLFYTAVCIPFPVLVLRTYMNGLSREMDEAARMDGAREITVFLRIVLPNVIGPMAAVFLLQFTWVWNDLLFSTILANRPETRSIMNALLVFQGSYSQQGPNIVMTGALIASIPTVVLFFLLRRHFMEGLRVS